MLGIVFKDGVIIRIINPDNDWELDGLCGPEEEMIKVSKEDWGVSGDMTLEQVHAVIAAHK